MTATPHIDVVGTLSRSSGVMADEGGEMPHGEIAAAVRRNVAFLDQNIAPSDCVSFICRNDLASATMLLALLAAGRSFVLLPDARPIGHAALPPEHAAFCRHRVEVGAAIAIAENPGWRGDLPVAKRCLFVPTSGSTGRAKLARHRHDRLWRAAGHCAARLGLAASDRVALPVPIAHMYGLGAAFLPAVLAGASIDLLSDANALRYLARERRFEPNVAFLTPSFGDALTRVRKRPRPYRLTVMAGDRLPAELFDLTERLHGCVVNLYGSTELGVIAAGDPADPVALRRDMVGRPMPGVAIRHGAAEGPEVADVLWYRHAYGFEGYVGADGHAAAGPAGVQASEAWFCSNDVGRVTDGYVAVHGRADDLVNRDGLLVGCGDVATALGGLDGIGEAVVLGGEPTSRGPALIAYCVAEPGRRWDARSLRKACLGVLPSRAVPDEFVFLPALPRLPGGKIDRVALTRERQAV